MSVRRRRTLAAAAIALASLVSVGVSVLEQAPSGPGAAAAATPGDACNPAPAPSPTDGTTPTPTPLPAYCPVPFGPEPWRPALGALFNEPRGSAAQQQVITNAEVDAVNHTRPGQLIQMATFIFDYPPVTAAVVRAYKRGVNVQLVVDGSRPGSGYFTLRGLLGRNPDKPSFAIACWHRCRDGITKRQQPGAMHTKLMAISRTGAASYWMLRTGGNLSDRASAFQWNEAYAISQDPVLWNSWETYFSQMAHQSPENGPNRVIQSQAYDGLLGLEMQRAAAAARSSVRPATAARLYNAKQDDLITRMKRIGCKAPAGYGVNGHTLIRIMMHSWYGDRGLAIVNTLIAKHKQGCIVQFLSDDGAPWEIDILQQHGVQVRATDWAWRWRNPNNSDGQSGWGPTFYAHLKVMMVNGVYQGTPMRVVWAGSQDWGSLGGSEELTLEIRNDQAYAAYNHEYIHLLKTASHPTGVRPYGPPPGGILPTRY